MLRVAILHYHLRPGGVTRVIQSALRALALSVDQAAGAEPVACAVIAGEPPSDVMPVPASGVVEALAYDSSSRLSAPDVLAEIDAEAARILGGPPDIWHIHNHSLGKNASVPALVDYLARQGRTIVLQPHDFAEDGRPENYAFLRRLLGGETTAAVGARLYPQGTHVHYAVINRRDWRFLRAAGVPERQLHYLPNAVSADDPESDNDDGTLPFAGRLFFYPARAIRRKNIGEFLLWAALADPDDRFAIARAPKNPDARPVYDAWVEFAQRLQLPVDFEFSDQWPGSFSSLLRSAYAHVSTSVAEGFGLAFLEPWLAGRPLVGRKLPEITDEFEHAGLDLSSLYTQLRVPLEWIGCERFAAKLEAALARVYAAYDRAIAPDDVERALTAASTGDHVDFGRLDEPLQRAVIERVASSPGARAEIRPATVLPRDMPGTVQANRTHVEQQFRLLEYGHRLHAIYQTAADSPAAPEAALNADYLLEEFLAPERFCLLRT